MSAYSIVLKSIVDFVFSIQKDPSNTSILCGIEGCGVFVFCVCYDGS